MLDKFKKPCGHTRKDGKCWVDAQWNRVQTCDGSVLDEAAVQARLDNMQTIFNQDQAEIWRQRARITELDAWHRDAMGERDAYRKSYEEVVSFRNKLEAENRKLREALEEAKRIILEAIARHALGGGEPLNEAERMAMSDSEYDLAQENDRLRERLLERNNVHRRLVKLREALERIERGEGYAHGDCLCDDIARQALEGEENGE